MSSAAATGPSAPAASSRIVPHRVWLGLALMATLLAFIGVARFTFVFDDLVVITNNPAIRSWNNLGWVFSHHLFGAYSATGLYYRPLNVIWFMLEYRLFGLAPAGWHLLSLAWHLAATSMVYFFCRQITGDRVTGALAALFFGLHPVHMESVAWISGPNDLMITALLIAAYLAFVRAREQGGPGRWALSLALYAAALLIKEPAIVLPAFLGVYEWTRPDGAEAGIVSRLRRTLPALVPHSMVAVVYLAVRRVVLGVSVGPGSLSMTSFLTAPSIAAMYVRHLVYPVGLSVIYDTPPTVHPGWSNFDLPLLICLAAAAALIYAGTRSRAGLLATAWFCIMLAPAFATLRSLSDVEFGSDRYVYLPSVGICVLLAMVVRRISARSGDWLGMPRLQSAAAVVLALALAAATATQLLQWASPLLLFYRAIQIAPHNPNAHIGLAVALRERGEMSRALAEFQEAYRLRPDVWDTNFYLGGAYLFAGRPAEAVPVLRYAIQRAPENSVAQYLYLGRALTITGQFDDAEQVMLRGRALAEAMQITAFFGPQQFDSDLQYLARRRAQAQSAPAR